MISYRFVPISSQKGVLFLRHPLVLVDPQDVGHENDSYHLNKRLKTVHLATRINTRMIEL